MRQIKPAEFIYILSGYKGNVWNFIYYFTEYYRRKQDDILWRVYISKLVNVYYPDMPEYYDIVSGKNVSRETPQEATNRLIEKINKQNGGDDL